MSNRSPLMLAIVGGAYAVSYGRPPGFETYNTSPLRLSRATRRCPRAAAEPQLDTAALTITRSPSTTGDIVRPPCVVKAAYSSPNERLQRRLPSGLSAIASAPPVRMKMFPVSGSTAGEAHAIRCAGTSLWKTLTLYSQITLPVEASSAITRSCSAAPRPTGFWTYTRSPITTGVDRPPDGTRQRKFSPFSFQELMSPVSRETPSRFGPLSSGQSPMRARRGPWAGRVTLNANATTAAARQHVLRIARILANGSRRQHVQPG